MFHIPTDILVFNVQETGRLLAVYHFCGRLKPSKQTKAQEVVSVWFLMAKQVVHTTFLGVFLLIVSVHLKHTNIGKPPFEIKNYIE